MPKAKNPKKLIDSLRTGDLAKIRAAIRLEPETARSAQVVGEAARLAWTDALKLLVKNGGDLNASWRNYRPLHAVIQEEPHSKTIASASRAACLKWMLDNGADPEQLGGWPASRAIITAAFVGAPDYITELRRAGAIVDGFVSATLGSIRGVEKALAKDSSFAEARDPSGLTALHCASGSRLGTKNKKTRDALLAIATLLLDNGADVNATVRSWAHDVDPVYFAVSSDQDELFGLLLDRGADATQALTPTVWRFNTRLAELALSHGAELDLAVDEGKPLLNQMIRWGQIKQTLWLLERGASPNVADADGWTAVHQAASRGNDKMLRAVLAADGDPKRRDNEGNTPLRVAEMRGRRKIVGLLNG